MTIRIIPAVDIMNGMVVRLYRGDPNQKTIYGDDPVAMALQWQEYGADMLHIVDLDATLGLGSNHNLVQKIVDSVSIPVQVAGGLRSVQSAINAAKTADRIVIGTLAFTDKKSLLRIAKQIGPERIVVSADHKDGNIVIRGWQDSTDIVMCNAVEDLLHDANITEFLITHVSMDGTLRGPDIEYLKQACDISDKLHIIASGGISKSDDVSLVSDVGAWGAILGRALYDDKITIQGARAQNSAAAHHILESSSAKKEQSDNSKIEQKRGDNDT